MKKVFKIIVPTILVIGIIASIGWYLFVYDRDLTRDVLLAQARFSDTQGHPIAASFFYDLAYSHSGHEENIAIELASQYKSDGTYTKAEYTLSNAFADGGTAELYIALCKTYEEQDKLLDAVNMLDNIANPVIKEQLAKMRPAAPSSETAPGFYTEYISVDLSSDKGTLYCTIDGEYPSTEDAPYSDPIALPAGETTIYAVSVDKSGLVSPLTILGYTVAGVVEEVTLTDPAIDRTVRELLQEWTAWRTQCVRRRIYFQQQRKAERLHLLKGLEKILLDIDKAIDNIRHTELESEVEPNLMIGFGIDEIQANFVAEI